MLRIEPGGVDPELIAVEGKAALRGQNGNVVPSVVIDIAVDAKGRRVAGRGHGPRCIESPVSRVIAEIDVPRGIGIKSDVEKAVIVEVAELRQIGGARRGQAVRCRHPAVRARVVPVAPDARRSESEDQIAKPVIVHVARVNAADRFRRGKPRHAVRESKGAIAEKHVRSRAGRQDVGKTVGVDIGRLEREADGAARESPRLAPRAVAMVLVEVQSIASAEGLADDIEPSVAVEISERRAEHAPRLAVCGEPAPPGCPRHAGAVAEGRTHERVAETAAAPVVVNAPGEIGKTVEVEIARRAPAIAEIARLMHRPRTGAVAEPDHDAVLAAIHVGRAVIAHRHDVEVAVAVEVVDLDLRVSFFHVRNLKTCRTGNERHAAARRRLVVAATGLVNRCAGDAQGERAEEHSQRDRVHSLVSVQRGIWTGFAG